MRACASAGARMGKTASASSTETRPSTRVAPSRTGAANDSTRCETSSLMTAPSSFDDRSQSEPGRAVLVANELGLEMKHAAVERARRSDRCVSRPCRGPHDHGHLAQPHAEDVERVDLRRRTRPRASRADRSPAGLEIGPANRQASRPARDPGLGLDLLGQDRADRLPVGVERSLEVDVGPGGQVADHPGPIDRQVRGSQSHFVQIEPIGARRVARLQARHHVTVETDPRARFGGPSQVVKLEPNSEVPEISVGMCADQAVEPAVPL